MFRANEVLAQKAGCRLSRVETEDFANQWQKESPINVLACSFRSLGEELIRPRRLTAYAVLAAWTIPCGIAVHLFAEIAGLGYQRGAALLFSGLHLYLAALAALSPVALFAALRREQGSDTRAAITRIAADFPFQGNGPRFFALSFTLQFGFFLVTQFGEGCPLRAGNFGIGLLAATITSAMTALVVSLCKTELLLVAAELFCLLDALLTNAGGVRVRPRINVQTSVRRFRALLRAAANLPPPCSPTTLRINTSPCFVGDACSRSLLPFKCGVGGFSLFALSALR